MSIRTQRSSVSSSMSGVVGNSSYFSIAYPPNAATILRDSMEKQRAVGLAFDLRDSENEEELRQKKARHQLLRMQIERRHEMELLDQQASDITGQLLDDLVIAIRDRQIALRPEGYQSIVFDNGDVYEGNWKSCRMHGKGCLKRVTANDLYEGEWFLGVRNGTGSCYSPDFSTFYSGKWQDGKWHGRGELIEPEGVYSGEFVDGHLQGYGEYVYSDKHVYKGDWVNGVYEGTGIYILPSGTKYEGQWVNGSEHGRGTMTYFNGDTYTGDWQHGLKHGQGIYTSAFLQYDGEWCYGAVQGQGECKYENGSTYEGGWLNGMYHGKGKFISPAHKQSYEGEFRYGKRCGRGIYLSEDVQYSGEWLDDKKHGEGEIITRGGGSFYGKWYNDLPHGEGVYTSNGEKVYMTYEYGKCVKTSPQGPYQQVNLRLLSAADKPA